MKAWCRLGPVNIRCQEWLDIISCVFGSVGARRTHFVVNYRSFGRGHSMKAGPTHVDQRVSLENLANRGSADVRGVQASVYKVSLHNSWS